MNDELDLDQKAVDELLATANKELSGLDTPPTTSTSPPEASEPAPPAQAIAPLPTKNSPRLFFRTLKQHLTKKIVLGIFLLFALVIGFSAYLGLKMADHHNASQPPLEKLTQLGITFEEKNLVTYAGRGDAEIVTAFLEAGMSANVVRPSDGWSPLIAACFYKRSDVVQLLLDQQATVNLQDKYGRTALMQATVMGAEDIVTLLLAYGANPNLQDVNGRTALMESYSKQYAQIAEILKNAGADPTLGPPKDVKLPPKLPFHPTKLQPVEEAPSPIAAESRLTVGKAGSIQIGMPLAELQKKYPSLTVREKYIDGTKKTIATLYINDQHNPTFELELSSGTLKLVSTISTDSEQFATDKQITVKSTVGDIRDQYTINDIKVINNSPFLVVKSIKMLFELDLSKDIIPTEWLATDDPTSIPSTTKIKRIVIY